MTCTGSDPADIVLSTLLARYWELLRGENYPHTPQITAEADKLEAAIRERQAKQS